MSNTSSERKVIGHALDGQDSPVDFALAAYHSVADIEITVTAELGRRSVSVDELLRLQVDDLVLLARPTGENIDLFAGDVLIGNAELLATGEKLAVRVADLLDRPSDSTRDQRPKQPGNTAKESERTPDEY